MTELLKADIFFFISSISAVILTIALIITLAYAVKAIQEARALMRSIQAEVDRIKEARRQVQVYARYVTKLPWVLRRVMRR